MEDYIHCNGKNIISILPTSSHQKKMNLTLLQSPHFILITIIIILFHEQDIQKIFLSPSLIISRVGEAHSLTRCNETNNTLSSPFFLNGITSRNVKNKERRRVERLFTLRYNVMKFTSSPGLNIWNLVTFIGQNTLILVKKVTAFSISLDLRSPPF